MREFNLDIFFADTNKRISHIHRVTFVLQPDIKVKGIDLLDGNFKFQHRIKSANYSVNYSTAKNLTTPDTKFNPMVKSLKEWLFRKKMAPLSPNAEDNSTMWRCSQEFTEEEKKFIKRLYLMEEL